MKKYLLIIILIALIIAAFLFFRNCEAQKKPTEGETTTDLTLYRDPFVYANTDFTCQVVKNSELAKDQELMKTTLDEAYRKYGFPVEDNETMLEILSLFENDEEVISEIKANVNECKTT
ncbi:MAG: hypothetical protein GWP15_00375 [Nitrospirae bacterium]|nr:hypothetical protein [Nitrospirota bacterium]